MGQPGAVGVMTLASDGRDVGPEANLTIACCSLDRETANQLLTSITH